ncbi:MAG: YncE family protein [Spirochaetia bacterium]|jgi:DNA-binding beta-propeller fold protein YncE
MRIGILTLLGAFAVAPLQAQSALTLTRSIPLPGVEGRIDHLAIDLSGERLFVAALGNNSLEVVDLRSFSVTHSIGGLSEPQGVAYIKESSKLYVANAGTGECDVYDGSSYALLKRISLGEDADNMHFAAASRQLLVAAGNGLSFIDIASDTVTERVGLPGRPEGFAVEQNGWRVFSNLPSSGGRLFVVDRQRALTTGQWRVGACFPLCLDEADNLLFIGTRAPARLHVMSTEGRRVVPDIGIDGDPDDVFYDAKRSAVYLSCGAGYIDVVAQLAPERYGPVTRIPTAQGARTSLWVPEQDRLFVAVPHRGDQKAEIRIYEPRLP